MVENAANLFVNAQPLLINLPKMLGEPAEKRDLVPFQNDKGTAGNWRVHNCIRAISVCEGKGNS